MSISRMQKNGTKHSPAALLLAYKSIAHKQTFDLVGMHIAR